MTILCYHSVQPDWVSPLNTVPEEFARQAAWLVRRRQVLPLDVAVTHIDASGRLPRGLAALTFDDGFESVVDHALPVLRRHSLPATVFVVVETLTAAGRPVDWVDTPPPYPLVTLSVDQVRQLADEGVDIQSHSYSHLDLTTLDYDACVEDLRLSREILEEVLGRRVTRLAYPRGRNNRTVRAAAAAAGYEWSFTLPQASEPVCQQGVPRVGIYQGNDVVTVAVKCSRPYLPLRTGRAFPLARRLLSRAWSTRKKAG